MSMDFLCALAPKRPSEKPTPGCEAPIVSGCFREKPNSNVIAVSQCGVVDWSSPGIVAESDRFGISNDT